MFGKDKTQGSERLPAPATRRAVALAPSLVGPDLTVTGDLSGPGELHIDGRVSGDVHVERLTIGESGSVEGAVEAQSVEVRGRLIGSIHAKLVRLSATAHVEADIAHEQITVELGAYFQGRCVQVGGTAPVASEVQITA